MAVPEKNIEKLVKPRALSDYLLSQGHPVVTLAEVAKILGSSPKLAADALVRLRRSAYLFSPTPGLYVAVPPQFRTWKVVPALDFIDPMMKALGREYYVGLLSAAEIHDAAHQRAQVLQVMVNHLVHDRDFGRVKLRFFSGRRVGVVPTELRNSSTGTYRVSSPATTVLDLALRPRDAGGLSNVATVLHELVEDDGLDARELLNAAQYYPRSAVRRLGWLFDFTLAPFDTDSIISWLGPITGRADVLLDAAGPRRGRSDHRWGIVVNAEVEADL